MPEMRFDGRVAVITGSGRGLGRAHALMLASRGAKIVVNDTGSSLKGEGADAGPAAQVVQEIKAAGGEAVACTESVATDKGCRAIIQSAMDNYGRVDILIHNAGNTRYGSLKEITDEDFHAVLNVHLLGAFHLVRAAFPLMCKARFGRIVLTSSIGGLYGNHRVVNYAISKSGMIGLNNVVALEGLDENVNCNVIVPGAVTRMAEGIDTSKFPDMRPELVAPAVGWLVHESCTVTGEIYAAMAGRIARVFIAEAPGVYQPSWTIEQVAEKADAIRNADKPVIFPVVPHGHSAHNIYAFDMATGGKASAAFKGGRVVKH